MQLQKVIELEEATQMIFIKRRYKRRSGYEKNSYC